MLKIGLGRASRSHQIDHLSPKLRSSTNASITRTWFSSDTKSSRYSGSKTPCRRSSPSTKRFIKNPDSIRQDSNSTDVFTQPQSTADLRGRKTRVYYG